MATKIINLGIYMALVAQLDKLAKHNRQGSYRTRERYYRAFKQFCAFLADVFRLRKLVNLDGKHLVAYVEYMQEQGLSASTIKTSLSAIRFFHDKLDRPNYTLPANDELGVILERRRFGGVDRTWSDPEFNKMLGFAVGDCRPDYVLALYLARYLGLRLHEAFRIDTAIAERTLREGQITIKGKNGKIRTVPVDDAHRTQLEIALREMLAVTPRGHKLLVPDDMDTHHAMNALERFIGKYRPEVQVDNRDAPLIYHGLRHTYASEKYQEFVDGGMNPLDAHLKVSELLGHERPDVTNIYLASRRKKEEGKAHG